MTADGLQLAVVVANTVTLVVGGFVTLLAVRAYRRTGSRSLRALSAGLGCITGGTLLGGLLHQSELASLLVGVTVHSASIALGFLLLAWSLFGPDAAFEPQLTTSRDEQ
ncbi:DUF7521 family protein [Natronomonas gomsonensis]|jgi:heme/copper-type cytochrome/quinol oxidase subunit 3|uniref:DUF7521 family protein n=1 Tax=Natronomonas gomsonensis TaxID=1046043 RepID=UPI0015BF51C2|nr:hypothetical protein [Natronomonas gomsonensis]